MLPRASAFPVRCAEPDERRNEIHAIVRLQRSGEQLSVSAACVDDAEPVAQPLHGGAGDEDRALERVGRFAARSQAIVVSKPLFDCDALVAGVQQQERAGAVRVLRLSRLRSSPGRTARPAGRRRCRRSESVVPKTRLALSPKSPLEGTHLRQQRARHAEQREQLVVPARCVSMLYSIVRDAFVGSVACTRAAGELPDQPAVDRAGRAARPLRRVLRAPDTLSSSHSILVAGEVRVEHEAGRLAHALLVALRLSSSRQRVGGAPVLPDDRAVRRARPSRGPRTRRFRAGS